MPPAAAHVSSDAAAAAVYTIGGPLRGTAQCTDALGVITVIVVFVLDRYFLIFFSFYHFTENEIIIRTIVCARSKCPLKCSETLRGSSENNCNCLSVTRRLYYARDVVSRSGVRTADCVQAKDVRKPGGHAGEAVPERLGQRRSGRRSRRDIVVIVAPAKDGHQELAEDAVSTASGFHLRLVFQSE